MACEIGVNINAHESWVKKAAARGADMVFFPELSLLGYEPKHAARFAMRADDARLDVFQDAEPRAAHHDRRRRSDAGDFGVRISMLVFQPNAARIVYSKQHLHADELPYFVAGNGQVTLAGGAESSRRRSATSRCSMLIATRRRARRDGLRRERREVGQGRREGRRHYPSIARRHSLRVLMANCVGPATTSKPSAARPSGTRAASSLARLPASGEGALLLDTATDETYDRLIAPLGAQLN